MMTRMGGETTHRRRSFLDGVSRRVLWTRPGAEGEDQELQDKGELGLGKLGMALTNKEDRAVAVMLTGTEESPKPPSLPRPRREVRDKKGTEGVLVRKRRRRRERC